MVSFSLKKKKKKIEAVPDSICSQFKLIAV